MRLPDATDQIRLAPLRALRAMFSGVGQLLLAADRLREEDARLEQESGDDQHDTLRSWDGRLSSSVRLISSTPTPAAPRSGGPVRAPGGKSERTGRGSERGTGGTRKSGRSKHAAEPARFRSLDLTGNVRMLSDQDIADLAVDQHERSTPGAQAHESMQARRAASGVQATDLPLSGYDELSLPSLRARLRNLDAAELRDLLAHERAHANRDDVVTMFERRIAKLTEPRG